MFGFKKISFGTQKKKKMVKELNKKGWGVVSSNTPDMESKKLTVEKLNDLYF